MDALDIYFPSDIADLIYKFAYSIRELFTTDNIRLCVVYLRMIDKFNLTNRQHKLITRKLLGEACRGGDEKIMELLFNRIKQKFNDGLIISDYRTNIYSIGYHEAYKKECRRMIDKLNDESLRNLLKYVRTDFIGICESGNLEAVRQYLKKYPNDASTLCEKSIYNACCVGYLNIVKLLIEHIDIPNYPDIVLHGIAGVYRGNHLHILNYLMKHTKHTKKRIFEMSLWGACRSGNINIVESLCAKYHDYDACCKPRWIGGLNGACMGGYVSMVVYVLEQISNSSYVNISWEDILKHGCIGGNIEIVKLIMRKIKNPFIFSSDCLNSASLHAHIELISFILKHNQQNSDGPASDSLV